MSARQQWFVAFCITATLSVLALILLPAPTSRVHFGSCKEAREVGAPLPLVEGEPGWSKALDPYGDGVAC